MDTNLGALFLIVGCVIVFVFSDSITSTFAKFFAQYPIIRLAPSSQHRARSKYLRIGATVVAATVAIAYFIRYIF